MVAAVVWAIARVGRRAPVAVIVLAPALAVVTRYGVELLWIPNMRSSWYTAPLFTLTGLAVAVVTSWMVRPTRGVMKVRFPPCSADPVPNGAMPRPA